MEPIANSRFIFSPSGVVVRRPHPTCMALIASHFRITCNVISTSLKTPPTHSLQTNNDVHFNPFYQCYLLGIWHLWPVLRCPRGRRRCLPPPAWASESPRAQWQDCSAEIRIAVAKTFCYHHFVILSGCHLAWFFVTITLLVFVI